jgi:hypothetical protein
MHDERGETNEGMPLPKGELGAAIQSAFEATESIVSVEAR